MPKVTIQILDMTGSAISEQITLKSIHTLTCQAEIKKITFSHPTLELKDYFNDEGIIIIVHRPCTVVKALTGEDNYILIRSNILTQPETQQATVITT